MVEAAYRGGPARDLEAGDGAGLWPVAGALGGRGQSGGKLEVAGDEELQQRLVHVGMIGQVGDGTDPGRPAAIANRACFKVGTPRLRATVEAQLEGDLGGALESGSSSEQEASPATHRSRIRR